MPEQTPEEGPAPSEPEEQPADSQGEQALPEKPAEKPAEEPAEEPAAPGAAEQSQEPDAPIEPEDVPPPQAPEEEPAFASLALKLETGDRVTYTLETEDEVVPAETAPALRLWDEQEYDKYRDFTDALPEDQQLVAAFVLSDGTEEETALTFSRAAEVFLCASEWDWKDSSRADLETAYTLYLSNDRGELKETDFDVLLSDDRDNEHGDALSFETKTLSCLVLTETVDGEVEEHTDLVEVTASDDEPLLANSELAAPSRRLLQGGQAPRRVAPGEQEAVSVDGMTIERITVRWLSKSTGSSTAAGFDRLELAPETDKVPNQQFQIDFSLSGKNEYEPGAVELVFPAYIWLDRNGDEPGQLTLSVPEDPDTGAEFAWRRVGDQIIITNTKRLSAASKVLIQGTFRNVEAHTMVDIDTADPDALYKGISDAFYATVNVVTNEGNVLTMTSNEIDASVDTYAQVLSASKTAYNSMSGKCNVYFDAPASLPADLLPDHPEDYFYVRWYISGTAKGNQPYTMTVADTAEDAYGCVMLGVEDSAEGNVKSPDGRTVSALLYDGYSTTVKSAYIWTAYPYASFPQGTEEVFTLHNSQTISVTGVDDEVTSTMTASSTVRTKLPTTYTFVKEWDDDNNSRGVRPNRLILDIYDDAVSTYSPWRTVTIRPDEDGNWTYQWDDEGMERQFRVREWLVDASGEFDAYYDTDGAYHINRWNYYLKDTNYDKDTHTWTYVNAYSEGWIEYDVSSFSKSTEWNYSDTTLRSTRDSALNELLQGRSPEVGYSVSGRMAVAWWTVKDGKKPVTVTVEDDLYTLNGEQMTAEDVEISAVYLNTPAVYAYTDYDDTTGYYHRATVDEPQTVTLLAYLDGSWQEMAVMTGGNVTVTENSGASASGRRVNLPSGVSKVKAELVTGEAIVDLGYNVYLRLKPTERMVGMVEEAFEQDDYIMFRLQNQAEAYATYNGEKLVSMRDPATAYLHGRQYKVAADLYKRFTFVENQVSNSRLRLRTQATLTQQSNVLDSNTYQAALADGTIPNTRGGTYYDLLPPGVEPDLSSITVSAGDRVLDAYARSDYQGSGRTLLVVRVGMTDHTSYTYYRDSRYSGNYPTEGYKNTHTIQFDSYYAWGEALSWGVQDLRNTIAYEADEQTLGNIKTWAGEPDDPNAGQNAFSRSAVGADAVYFTDLDPKRDDPAFAYAGADLDIDEIDVSALTSLRKHVMAVGFPRWGTGIDGTDINVQEGGLYTYRLYVQSDTDTRTKDIILLDSIESYIPQESDGEDYGADRWRGQLLSVDVSQLRDAGVDPVIYYSTVPGLDISREAYNPELQEGAVLQRLLTHTINGQKVWSATPPADLSQVTAVAIDASKQQDGGDFELEPDETLMVYLHMMAPSGTAAEQYLTDEGTDPALNAHAFNNLYLDARQSILGQATHAYINYNYTKIGIFTHTIQVEKVWDDQNDNDAMRPEFVTVHLLADGEDTGLALTLDENSEWKGEFKHLKTYNDDGSYITYTFTEDPVEGYTLRIERDGDTVTLINRHDLIQTEYPVTKVWQDDDNVWDRTRPEYITLRLYANDIVTDEPVFTGRVLTVRPDDEGQWAATFTGLNKYDRGHEIVYSVKEDMVTDYITTYSEEGNEITNRYYPYGDLIISKTVVNGTDAALEKDFTVVLEMTTPDGEGVIDRYSYETSDGRTGRVGNGGELTLKHGQTVTVKDIPSGVRYRVTEVSRAGFELTGSVNTAGIIRSDQPCKAELTNTYSSRGTAQLSAHKTLIGHAMTRYQFQFRIEDQDHQQLTTANNQANGDVQFGYLRYTEANDGQTYTYYVAEVDKQRPGYTYDSTVYRVEITPHDKGDGTMDCEVVRYDSQDNQIDALEFANEYHASGSIELRAWKSLDGRTAQNGEFTFQLLDSEGNVLQTKQNDQNAEIIWERLSFTEADAGKTYFYVAREVPGTDPTVIYDDTLRGYEIVVSDNNDGTLSFTQNNVTVQPITEEHECETCGGTGLVNDEACPDCSGTGKVETVVGYQRGEDGAGLPVFYNELSDGNLSIAKYTTWDQGYEPDPDKEFHFQVRLVGDKAEEIEDLDYEMDQVPNIGVQSNPSPASAPTSGSGRSIVPTTNQKTASGQLSDSVIWTLYADGTFVIEPTNGVSGSFSGNPWAQASGQGRSFWPWTNVRGSVKRLTVNGRCSAVGSVMYMFCDMSNVTEMDLSGLDLSQATSMFGFFELCASLTTVDVSSFDTSNVEDFGAVFWGCSQLKAVNLGHWNTSSAIMMNSMFYACSSLTAIDLRSFDMSNVKYTSGVSYPGLGNMFSGCSRLALVRLGPNFGFYGENTSTTLPSGTWQKLDDASTARSESNLRDTYNSSLAGIWVRQGYTYDAFYYNVTFDANGGEGNMDDLDVVQGEAFTLPICTFRKSGAPFLGWSLTPEGEILNYLDGQFVDDIEADAGETVTLYAIWGEADKYTVVFRAPAGCGGSMATRFYEPGAEIQLPENGFYRYDHYFVGWSVDDSNTVTYEDKDAFTAGNAGEKLILTAVFLRYPHSSPVSGGTFDFTLKAGEKITLKDLPAGTAYQIWEETPGGWKLLEQRNASGTIQPTVTAEAEFVNKFQPEIATATIVGTKTLDGRAAGEGAFRFQLLEGTEVLQTVSNLAGGFVRFADLEYRTAGEHVYTVREVQNGSSSIEYDTHTETVRVSVTMDEDGQLTAQVTYDSDGVNFINTTRPGTLEITKQGVGVTEANQDTEFEFKVRFSNENGVPLPDGEGYSWYVRGREGASNPTPARSNPTPAGDERTAVRSGDLSSTVQWTFYSDGELVIEPKEGLQEGTFEGVSEYNSSQWPWYSFRKDITKVTVKRTCKLIGSAYYMFGMGSTYSEQAGYSIGQTSLTEVDLSGLDTSQVTNMSDMFYYCDKLTTLDMTGLDTGNVTNFSYIFGFCRGLTSINVSTMDTGSATNMDGMFAGCASLTALDVSNFDTSSATSMWSMFRDLTSLTALDLSHFDTHNVQGMGQMFRRSSGLTSLNLSGWDVSKVTNMWAMFQNCYGLKALDLSTWIGMGTTSPDLNWIFWGCTGLRRLDLSSWTTHNGGGSDVFTDCTSLASITLGPGFSFGSGSMLPTPPTEFWMLEDNPDSAKTAEDLAAEYTSSDAGTWVWMDANNVCIVRFDANGGYTTAAPVGVKEDTESITIPDESSTARYGFDFIGWNTEPDGSGVEVTGLESIADRIEFGSTLSVYAQWVDSATRANYQVIHYQQNTNLGGYYVADSQTLRAAIDSQQTPAVKSYPGFVSPEPRTVTVLEDGSTTVEYYYDRCRYTLEFDGNGADSGELASLSMISGVSAVLPYNKFVKANAIFLGWNTAADGSGTNYGEGASFSYMSGQDEIVTLYARWFENAPTETQTDGEITVRCKMGETIVIPNLPAGTRYEVTEVNLPDGWTQSGSQNTAGTIWASSTSSATVTNTYYAEGYASLTAHKRLVGGSVTSGQFTFELADIFDTSDEVKYAHTPNLDDDGISHGNYTNNMNDRQTVTLDGVNSLHVTVTYYTESGYDYLEIYRGTYSGGTGGGAVARLTGGKDTVELEIPDDTVTFLFHTDGSVTRDYGYYAVVTDGSHATQAEVTANGPVDTITEMTDEDGNVVSNPWYGTAPVAFNTIKFTEPGEYVYYIREQAGSASEISYDTHVEEVHIIVFDNGDGSLGTNVVYDEDGALFTNRVKTGSLTVTKTVKNGTQAALAHDFTFAVSLKDASGNDLPDTYKVEKSDGTVTTVANGGTVQIKAEESFTILDLPHGCLYEVTEQDLEGYEITDSSNTSGQINAGRGSHIASFENTYFTTGSVTLGAHKTLLGGTLRSGQFRFQLLDAERRVLETAWAEPDGTVTFSTRDFTQEDDGKTFIFYISELEGEDEDIIYDTHEEEVRVKVTDNGAGTMTVTTQFTSGEQARFTNARLCSLTVSKTVAGNMGDVTARFPFTLALTRNGEAYTGQIEAPEGVNWTPTGEGTYTFTLSHSEEFTLIIPGGVDYAITEAAPEDYEVSVSVTDAEGAEVANAAQAPDVRGSMDGDRRVDFTNTREGVVPTAAETPAALPAFGIGALALTGLAVLVIAKRRKKKEV